MPIIRTQLKTGQRKVQPNIRVFKENDILFKEGDRGREMFILREGEIKITHKDKDGEVELARLGAGSVIGEMSLLDNMPRSASGIATKPTKATVINELVFNTVLQKVPAWLTSIVKIILYCRGKDFPRRLCLNSSIKRSIQKAACSSRNWKPPA